MSPDYLILTPKTVAPGEAGRRVELDQHGQTVLVTEIGTLPIRYAATESGL